MLRYRPSFIVAGFTSYWTANDFGRLAEGVAVGTPSRSPRRSRRFANFDRERRSCRRWDALQPGHQPERDMFFARSASASDALIFFSAWIVIDVSGTA